MFKVNLNFFAEKHGKSCRDTHFSMVSKFIYAESLVKKLTCSADFVEAILKRQNMANENNKGLINPLLNSLFCLYCDNLFKIFHLELLCMQKFLILK